MVKAPYHQLRRPRAVAPAGCPVDHGFSPYRSDYLKNPYPGLRDLRTKTPVFYTAELGYVGLTRMADVAEVFKRADVFSSEIVQDPVLPICAAARAVLDVPDYAPIAVISNCAPPDHTRIRKHTLAGFSARRMRVLAPYIRTRAETLVAQMLADGEPAEFVRAIGHPLPGETIFRLIGFPEADDPQLKKWATNRLAFTWGQTSDAEQVEIATNMLAYWRHCVAFVAYRWNHPGDDFTSELLAVHRQDPTALSYQEIESIIYGLSFAGHEIVTNFLGNGLICLLSERARWQALCDDPSRIENALNEILRFNSPQTSWRRVALKDTEIAGQSIPAGTYVFLSLAAANHDDAVFADAARFDAARSNARNHISFGRGAHFCIGNRLALLEAQIAFETLTEQVPSLALVSDQNFTYFPNFTFRGPRELRLTWGTS